MINTLNETSLHKSLKAFYRIQCNGKTEEKVGAYIVDILCPDGGIIEIQTGTLGKLKSKAEFFLLQNRKIKIVYPLAALKYIETRDTAGKITRRKSPLKKSIYSAFREITALVPVLLDKNFTLEIIEAVITEERIKTEEPIQSKNRRRRFKKDWQKTGKRLDQLGKVFILHGKSSYKKLIPENLPETFTSKDFFESLKQNSSTVKRSDANFTLWILSKIGIINEAGKRGNAKIYSMQTNCCENALLLRQERPRRDQGAEDSLNSEEAEHT